MDIGLNRGAAALARGGTGDYRCGYACDVARRAGAPGACLSTDLAERLRGATRELHARTERTALMARLLAGRLPTSDYCKLLRNLHALYAALESAIESRHEHPALAALPLQELSRRVAIEQDLQALHGTGWQRDLVPTPAGVAYAQRLQALAETDPAALLAHAYVRYLGDLHGGQVVRRQVARSLGLPDDASGDGTRFFDFGSPEQVLALRQHLRAALAAAALDPAQQDRIVAEACWGFEQHVALFEQLVSA